MSTTTTTFPKDPSERLDYSWDWGPWLAEVGDTIGDATVEASDGPTTVGDPVVNGGFVTQRVEGGAVGDLGKVVCTITTSSGLIGERTIYLSIQDR